MDGYTSEPVYENVQKAMDDVTDIDERVIIFLNVVTDAPRDIQKLTDNFLAIVDKLKRNYISNIVKTKVTERKHSASEEYVDLCVNEYNSLKRKDSYLDQVSSEDHHVVSDKLEKAKLEVAMRFCQLQLSVRELELSKEKLGRLSKRAEHNFMCNLRNHPDRSWAQVYKNDSQRHKTELKRVCTVPAVLPKPKLKVPLPHGDSSRDCKCCRRSASTVQVKSSKDRVRSTRQCHTLKHVKGTTRPGTVLTKTESLEACVESYSSDEEFPAPPPPLAPSDCVFDTEEPFNLVLVSTGKSKRLSDRSAVSDRSIVDEGIGDIDWNPSQGTSVCGSEADDTQRIAEIDNDELNVDSYKNSNCLQDEETTDSNIYDDVMVDLPCESPEMTPEIALTPDYENVQTTGITADDNLIEVLPSTETTICRKKSPLEVNVLHSNDVECSGTPVNEKTTTHSDSQLNCSEMPGNKNKRHKVNFTEQGTSSCRSEDISNTTVTDDMISDRLKDLKTTDVEDGCRVTSSVDGLEKHVYEDRSFLQTSHKHKKEKTKKKKKKMTFLTKVFRGPWEGWESE